jgi:Ca2+-binding EF-hand superfamily protein
MISKPHLLTFVAIVLVCALPSTLFAAKGNKSAAREKSARPGRVLKQFDTNHNGSIDGDEIAALRKAFEAFKAFDKDGNGTLEDSEVAAIKPGGDGSSKANKRERKRKKNA